MAVTVCFIIIIILSTALTGAAQVVVIRFEPERTVYIEGEALTIRCLAEKPSNIRSYSFFKDGSETQKTNSNILSKPLLTRTDSGLYFCTYTRTTSNDSTESNPITLNVIEPFPVPTLRVFPSNPQTENTEVQLICETALPSTIHGYRFYKDGREVTGTAGQKDNVFVIAEYNSLSEGCYFCQTFRVELAQEIKSPESSMRFLTNKEIDRRGCDGKEIQIDSVFSLQGIKLYGSVLVGKILVLLLLSLFFGVRITLINLRIKKAETEPQR
eukprot:XP_012826757.1 PREDICTED: Fc receptor-like A isoform X2 [Xenopus tropicalis]